MRFQCGSKADGLVCLDFKVICGIVVFGPMHVVCQWNIHLTDARGIHRQVAQDEFNADLGAGAGINWT